MKNTITFEDIDPNNLEHAHEFIKWTKDSVMNENWFCQRPDSEKVEYSIEQFKEEFNYSDKDFEIYGFIMKVDGACVGYGQIIINQGGAFTKDKRVSWPSVAVGESANRSKGLGTLISQKVYEISKLHNCDVIEVGIFEFNNPIKQLLLKNGFKLIGKKEKITYIRNRWWNAEHYLLPIN